MGFKAFALAGTAISLLALPALAHHTDQMIDSENPVEFSATVKELQWANPHGWLQVMIADDNGKLVEWALELGSPGALARGGWVPTTVVPGDEVTVTLHPLKDGSPGGRLVTLELPDGTVLGE